MPPKKKKPPSKLDQDDQELVDVFSYVELVQDCLERAEGSQKACLEGIIKADLALRQSQSDADIHSIVLVRRAELLLIAAKNHYDTNDLPAAHRNPLKSCIDDCERVIGKVSAADPISKGIYEQACTILRGAKEIQRFHSSKPVEGKGSSSGTFQRYDPTKTLFRNVTKINPYLLQDVVNCYNRSKTVCRSCFYKHKYQEPIGSNRHCRRCKRTAHPLVLIPASQMCDNLIGAKMLAVPSPPKAQMALANKHKPFQMCKKSEHKLCFDKSASGDTWFAHSIEELVVWTVERHYDVKFSRYIEVYHREHDPPDHSLFDDQAEQGISNLVNSSDTGGRGKRPYDYYPAECTFPSVASIPERLFWDVLNCYKNYKEYCKWCYYQKDERGVVVINRRSNSTMCSNCQQPWESVIVISASSFCWNFGNFDELPIASWPKDKPTRDPFEYCRKKDHYRCFRVYIDNFWYPHSVEELVIWTVERERKCTFRQFMQKAIQLPSPLSSPRQTPPPSSGSSTSASVPISGSKSPQKQQQQHSPLQNSTTTAPPHGIPPASPNTAAIGTPSKKMMKGPPSPLTFGAQSPPPSPSFSSVAAAGSGQSPKRTSPFLPNKVTGQGSPAKIAINSSGGNRTTMTGVGVPMSQIAAASVVSTGGAVGFVGQSAQSRPGKLADITGPADTFEPVGFPFIVPQYSTTNHIMGGIGILTTAGALSHPQTDANNTNNLLTFAPNNNNNYVAQVPQTYGGVYLNSVKGGVGVGSGINSVAGSGSPVVASVSSRRNYRVASTSADSLKASPSPTSLNPDPTSTATATAGSTIAISSGFSVGGQLDNGFNNEGDDAVSPGSFSYIPEGRVASETVTGKALYKFSEVNFKLFSDIPQSLLREIANCFKDKKLVCRRCFYGDRSISHLVQPKNKCSSGEHSWSNPVLVIPGCVLCDNEPLFKHGEHVAVPPLPPVAIIKKCEKLNHHKCFAQSLEADQRFAHSVEELVVWIVESENECSFEQFAATSGLLLQRSTQLSSSSTTITKSDTTKSSSDTSKVNFNPNQTQKSILSQQPSSASSATIATFAEQPAASISLISAKPKGKKQLYDPKNTEFVRIKDIPTDLLIAVAECFHDRLFVCRICFFESNCSKLVSKIETKQAIMCENNHTPWKQIKVIPRCKLCITPADHAPIPPLPKHMKNSNIPFAVCKKAEHQTCYAMSRGTNPWFPHTVEELVIWTVEREKGIDFEDCYKEYLPTTSYATAKKLTKDNLDPISPPARQTISNPTVTFQSTVSAKTTPTIDPLPVTSSTPGLPEQVSSIYSKPEPQNGFSNALDLANMPQMRMGGGAHNNQNFVDFSLTQPEPYHSAFPSEFGFSPSMQFGFPSHPLPPHPNAAAGGMAPISVLIPPPLASTSSTNPDPSGIGAGGGDSFTDFFPALLSENPLNGDSQEAIPAESGKKSVGDLFNLTAGLDVFEDPPVLERNVNREIGEVDTKKGGPIESSWNQPLTGANKNNNTNGPSLQANKQGHPFIGGSKEANETIVGEESVNGASRLHPLGRMDSFGFTTSLNSEAPGFDAGINMQEATAPHASSGNPNWPNFDQIPSTQIPDQPGTLNNLQADESSKSKNYESKGDAETLIQKESTKVKGDQKVVDRAKASPKGKKKKKKGAKSSSKDTSSRSGNGAVKNVNIASVPPPPPPTDLGDGSTGTSEDVTSEASTALTEELASIEERKPRSTNYSLSSSSTPTLVGVSSVTGFRSEGHTPPINTSEVTGDLPATTTTTTNITTAKKSSQPFQNVFDSNENSSMLPDHGAKMEESRPSLERGIDDIFDGDFQDVSELAATFGRMEGKSSLLSSIMAARAKTNEADMGMVFATDDIPTFKSSTNVSVFERIKDIEDDSSQESHENDQAKELTDDPLEGSEAVQQQYNVNSAKEVPTQEVPTKEIPETTETTTMEQLPQASSNHQGELLVPDMAIEPTKPYMEPAKSENSTSESEKVAMPEERDPISDDTIADSTTAIPSTHAAVGEGIVTKPVVPSESKSAEKAAPLLLKESSVDPDPQPLSEEAKKLVAEWDLSPSSDEFDLNIEGEDQTLQHVPIEDWGCTLSDENN